MNREEMIALYHRYLELCNRHRFEELDQFVAADVGGLTRGLGNYIAGCHEVVRGFKDYRWSLQHVVIEGVWLAARLWGDGTNTGTFRGMPPTGRVVRTQELVQYRFDNHKIAECWATFIPRCATS